MQSDSKSSQSLAKMQRLRVLFLPKNSRTAYFQGFLAAAKAKLGWDIRIVGPEAEKAAWTGVADEDSRLVFTPDFTEAQAWEKDAAAVEAIDRFINECERALGVPAARILLAGERDIGRGFSRANYHWFNTRIAARSLADNGEPTRILRRMFVLARDTLATVKPDIVMSGEWADPLCFVFYLVAQRAGIRCLVNRPSKLLSGRCYWAEDLTWYNTASRALAADKERQRAPVSQQARDRLAKFRATPTTLGYVRKNWDADEARGWLKLHRDIAGLLARQVRYNLGGRKGPAPKPALQLAWEHYRRAWLKYSQARFFTSFSDEELKKERFIYIAMHKDPEQALNAQAPFWAQQFNTISLLSSVVPVGYKLMVREHRRNAGRRPTRFYRELSELPSVVLVSSFDNQFKYISNAALIITENGSTGWEGLMLGKRVITLSQNFYDGTELAIRVRTPEQLANLVVERLKRPGIENSVLHDQKLGWVLDAEMETTVPLEDPGYSQSLGLLAEQMRRPAVLPAAMERKRA